MSAGPTAETLTRFVTDSGHSIAKLSSPSIYFGCFSATLLCYVILLILPVILHLSENNTTDDLKRLYTGISEEHLEEGPR